MSAAALQRLLALRVKASPIYEHVREKLGAIVINDTFSRSQSVENNCACITYSYTRSITMRTKPF